MGAFFLDLFMILAGTIAILMVAALWGFIMWVLAVTAAEIGKDMRRFRANKKFFKQIEEYRNDFA